MQTLVFFTLILKISVITCFSLQRTEVLKRSKKDVTGNIGCIHMESYPGEYWYVSDGSDAVCGLFLIGAADQLVEIEFQHFDIECDKGGLMEIVDGWEIQGQLFPNAWDHPNPQFRYQTYCGKKSPLKIFLASQNVALIQFRIPVEGQGFKINVNFPDNPTPCNIISMVEEGVFTLRNYGKRSNCSMSILYPENIQMIELNVGQTREVPTQIKEIGTMLRCAKRKRRDFVELLDGDGFDPRAMWREMDMCGMDSKPSPMIFQLGCQHSVVRLVSSGQFYNSVTFRYKALSEQEQIALGDRRC